MIPLILILGLIAVVHCVDDQLHEAQLVEWTTENSNVVETSMEVDFSFNNDVGLFVVDNGTSARARLVSAFDDPSLQMTEIVVAGDYMFGISYHWFGFSGNFSVGVALVQPRAEWRRVYVPFEPRLPGRSYSKLHGAVLYRHPYNNRDDSFVVTSSGHVYEVETDGAVLTDFGLVRVLDGQLVVADVADGVSNARGLADPAPDSWQVMDGGRFVLLNGTALADLQTKTTRELPAPLAGWNGGLKMCLDGLSQTFDPVTGVMGATGITDFSRASLGNGIKQALEYSPDGRWVVFRNNTNAAPQSWTDNLCSYDLVLGARHTISTENAYIYSALGDGIMYLVDIQPIAAGSKAQIFRNSYDGTNEVMIADNVSRYVYSNSFHAIIGSFAYFTPAAGPVVAATSATNSSGFFHTLGSWYPSFRDNQLYSASANSRPTPAVHRAVGFEAAPVLQLPDGDKGHPLLMRISPDSKLILTINSYDQWAYVSRADGSGTWPLYYTSNGLPSSGIYSLSAEWTADSSAVLLEKVVGGTVHCPVTDHETLSSCDDVGDFGVHFQYFARRDPGHVYFLVAATLHQVPLSGSFANRTLDTDVATFVLDNQGQYLYTFSVDGTVIRQFTVATGQATGLTWSATARTTPGPAAQFVAGRGLVYISQQADGEYVTLQPVEANDSSSINLLGPAVAVTHMTAGAQLVLAAIEGKDSSISIYKSNFASSSSVIKQLPKQSTVTQWVSAVNSVVFTWKSSSSLYTTVIVHKGEIWRPVFRITGSSSPDVVFDPTGDQLIIGSKKNVFQLSAPDDWMAPHYASLFVADTISFPKYFSPDSKYVYVMRATRKRDGWTGMFRFKWQSAPTSSTSSTTTITTTTTTDENNESTIATGSDDNASVRVEGSVFIIIFSLLLHVFSLCTKSNLIIK